MRQAMSKGGASGIQSGIAYNAMQRGLTGTGLGLTMANMAQTAPEIASFNNALEQASKQQAAKIDYYSNKAGIAAGNLNVQGGYDPGFGNALMGLYGAGSNIYGNYKSAKAGQQAGAEWGAQFGGPSGDFSTYDNPYADKNNYQKNYLAPGY
jgi:hypothetical protein